MQLLVGGTIDKLWVKGFLVVGIGGSPMEGFATAGGEADAVDIERV